MKDKKASDKQFHDFELENSGFSELKMDGFVLVRPDNTDSFNSLALRFLGDENKGWLIAKFNRQEEVLPGKPLVIPLETIYLGGLKEDSYQTVPVLVYHQFADEYSDKMTIRTEAFYKQMLWLKENGYKVIRLDQLLDFMDFKIPLPEKSVVITIDDGWISVYEIAYPILKEFGFPATLFVYTDFIGGEKAMKWSQIQEMAQDGFDVQSHTQSHRSLSIISENEPFEKYFEFLVRELEGSKKVIEDYLGSDCRYLAYPFGETNELVKALVEKIGYRAAFTVNRGSTPFFGNRYTIRRSVIYGDSDIDEFVKNISCTETITLK
ncbi:MAG: polysaccharide deacetylase family protein [Desulfobacterales bacterium]